MHSNESLSSITPNSGEQETHENNSAKIGWDLLKAVPFRGAIERKYQSLQQPLIDARKNDLLDGNAYTNLWAQQNEISGLKKAQRILLSSPVVKKILPQLYTRALCERQKEAENIADSEYSRELNEQMHTTVTDTVTYSYTNYYLFALLLSL